MTRLNARLDRALAEKFVHLTKVTGKTASTLMREAIELYYARWHREESDPLAIFTKNRLIAAGSGKENLSETYKERLQQSLVKKHGHR